MLELQGTGSCGETKSPRSLMDTAHKRKKRQFHRKKNGSDISALTLLDLFWFIKSIYWFLPIPSRRKPKLKASKYKKLSFLAVIKITLNLNISSFVLHINYRNFEKKKCSPKNTNLKRVKEHKIKYILFKQELATIYFLKVKNTHRHTILYKKMKQSKINVKLIRAIIV